MSKRSWNKIVNIIAGKSEHFTIEHRFLNASLIVTLLAAIFVAIDNAFISKNLFLLILDVVFFISTYFLHYLSRFRSLFIVPAVILFVLMLALLNYSWILFGGMNGPSPVFFAILFSFCIFLFKGLWRKFISGIIIVSFVILIIYDVIGENFFGYYEGADRFLVDLNIGAVIFILILAFVVINFKKGYIKQQELLVKAAESLRSELNEKKLAQQKLEQFNLNLENLLDIRTKELQTELLARQKAENDLIYEHSILKAILSSIPESVTILDKRGLLVDCNVKTLELICEDSKCRILGKSFFDLMKEKNHEKIAEQVRDSINNNSKLEFEYSFIDSKGNYVVLALILGTVNIPETDSQYIILVAKDVTIWKKTSEDLLKISQELKESNAAKDKFLSIIAHDLRNPLNAIIGFSDLLKNSYDNITEKDKKRYIENINLASELLYKLLQNLLEWSRTQTGTIKVNPEEFNLFNTLTEVAETFYYQAANKKITIQLEVKENVYVYADREMVKTILRNLISNALKFTHSNGLVKIVSNEIFYNQNQKNYVEISVIDNGIGIKKENLEKILKIGHNIKTYGTENEPGTGMGLILVRELIEKNHGNFFINSVINSGTTFTFSLPKNK